MGTGRGATVLRVGSVAAYGLAWSWLLVVLLADGQPLVASSLLVGLILVVMASRNRSGSAGLAAIAAGAAWALGVGLGPYLDPSASIWVVAAACLFLLPAVVGMTQFDRARYEFGPAGLLLGTAPVLIGALVGGMLGPISGQLAQVVIAVGVLIVLGGAVPFAVVRLYARMPLRPAYAALMASAIVQISLGGIASSSFIAMAGAALAATAFGICWATLGLWHLTGDVSESSR